MCGFSWTNRHSEADIVNHSRILYADWESQTSLWPAWVPSPKTESYATCRRWYTLASLFPLVELAKCFLPYWFGFNDRWSTRSSWNLIFAIFLSQQQDFCVLGEIASLLKWFTSIIGSLAVVNNKSIFALVSSCLMQSSKVSLGQIISGSNFARNALWSDSMKPIWWLRKRYSNGILRVVWNHPLQFSQFDIIWHEHQNPYTLRSKVCWECWSRKLEQISSSSGFMRAACENTFVAWATQGGIVCKKIAVRTHTHTHPKVGLFHEFRAQAVWCHWVSSCLRGHSVFWAFWTVKGPHVQRMKSE